MHTRTKESFVFMHTRTRGKNPARRRAHAEALKKYDTLKTGDSWCAIDVDVGVNMNVR